MSAPGAKSRQTDADALERLRNQKEQREQKQQQRKEQKKKPVVKNGWMVKKGAKRRNWKRRYFQLRVDEKDLRYFPSPKTNVKPLGVINLTQVLRVRPEKLFKAPGAPAFSILLPNRCYILIAEDEVERDLWMKKIKSTGVTITSELPKFYFGSKDWEDTSKLELMELTGKSTVASSVFSGEHSSSPERARSNSKSFAKLFGLTKKASPVNVKSIDQSLSQSPIIAKSNGAIELQPTCTNGSVKDILRDPRGSLNETIVVTSLPEIAPIDKVSTQSAIPVEKNPFHPISKKKNNPAAEEYEEVEVEEEYEEEVEDDTPIVKPKVASKEYEEEYYEWQEDYEEIEEIIEWVEEDEEFTDLSKRMSKLHTAVSQKIDQYKTKVETTNPDIATKKVMAYENHMKRMTLHLENKMKRQTTNFQNMDDLLKLLNEQKA